MVVGGLIQTAEGCVLADGFNALPTDVADTVCFGAGDRTKLGPGAVIRKADRAVRPWPCDKTQVGAKLMGLATRLAFTCRSCSCNAERALCHRHGVAAPPVKREFGVTAEFFRSRYAEVRSCFVEQRAHWQEAWMEKWPATKRALIVKSVEEDEVLPGVVHAMVKRESGHERPSRPRLIQYYPNLATQAAFGPEFFALQKAYTYIFRRREMAKGVRVTFASCMNAGDLGDWMAEVLNEVPDPHFYERDGKNWDSTMQREHLELRLEAYACAGPAFAAFVRAGYKVRGKAPKGDLRYTLVGTVKSGHNDTTLGNSLVNAAIAVEAMVACGLRGDVIVAGDDLLTVVHGDFDEVALARAEAEYGIVPEYRKFHDARDVSFVSGVWFNAGRWVFMPKPGRLVARLFWSTHPPPAKDFQAYRNGIVLGLRASCSGIPVLGAFLEAHYDPGKGHFAPADKRALMYAWSGGNAPCRAEVMREFCYRYHLTEAEVLDCERMLSSCRGLVGLVSHPVLTKMMDVDLADPQGRLLSL